MVEQHRVKVGGDADVARARRAAHAALDGRSDDCVYSAELIVSELVTNALLHGGGSAQLTVLPIQDGARIEVSDGNRNTPLVGVATADAMTGRGLHLVARLAARWGVDPTEAGKVVWAEVVDAPRHRIEPSEEDLFAAWADSFDSELEDLRVRVSLGHVPTGLLVAAKRHIDNLVREFTLAAGGGRSRTTAPVPVALAELIDRVVHRFEDARLEIKRQATAAARAGSSHTFLELDLPVDAADAAEQYVEALDEADEYCRANRVLTLETPPQHRLFRRWYTGEIVKQLRAVQAGRARPEVMPFEQRLLEEVDNADLARRRAERAARLYSVAVALAAAATPEDVATAVLRDGVAALGATAGGVLLAGDDDTLEVPGTIGYDGPTVEMLRAEPRDAELPAAYVVRTGESVWLETIEERDARFPGLARLEPQTMALSAVPIMVDGNVLGALRFSFAERRLFDADEQRFALALAAETGEALQRARLLQSERETRRRLEHQRASLEKLSAVGEAMLRHQDVDSVLQLATDAATQVAGAEFGAFFYNAVDAAGESYVLYTLSGVPRAAFEQFPMPRNTEIFGPTFSGSGVVRLDDVTADPRYGRNPPFNGMPAGHLPVRSYLAVPVTLSNEEVAGGLFFGHAEPARFDEVAERLVVGVAGLAAAAIENMRSLEDRVRVATVLQRSLLPTTLPSVPGTDIAAAYSTAAEGVGGDFYDIFPVAGDRWTIVIGDVRGRGPEAAAITALARYTIRTAMVLGRGPAEAMAVLNDAIRSDEDEERFCSVVVGVLEIGSAGATLTYANGGHPPVAVVRADVIDWALPTGALVGILANAAFSEESIALAPGETVVLYTDGLSEARRDGEEFGEAHLVDVLASLRGEPAEAMATGLTQAARAFAGDTPSDDSAVLVVRINEPRP